MNDAPMMRAEQPQSYWKMWLILAICAAPVLASYALYFFVRPEGRVNYGDLIEPQRDLPQEPLLSSSGEAKPWSSWRGKWVLVTLADAACGADCVQRLYIMRQVRLTTGRDQDRIERVWVVTDRAQPPAALLDEHPGLRWLYAPPQGAEGLVAAFPAQALPLPEGLGHIFVVDPLGHVMMRFPLTADPNRIKKDITRLLRASRVG